MSLDRAEKLARLRLWRTPRVGPATFRNLIARFGSATETLARLPDHMRALGKSPLKIPAQDQAIQEIEALHALGGRFIFMGAPEYPELLNQIEDAPPVFAAVGRLELLERPHFAIVGSRNASLSGKNLTKTYATELGAAGYVIVSGLAKGIDGAAHQAGLERGTIAVVAGGADVIYPKENANLQRQLMTDGLIISEQPLGMPTSARLFPLRNRLVSGLCAGTLVVEANERSGSLITARLAGEQGREVFAIPGSPNEGRSTGTNQLIKQGAHLVTQTSDILDVLGTPLTLPFQEPDPDFTAPTTQAVSANSLIDLILENLSTDPIPIDALTRECEVTAAVMQTALADLEIAGLIDRHPGGQISRAS